jgi:Spy/CpxP family protein refolding chaperone
MNGPSGLPVFGSGGQQVLFDWSAGRYPAAIACYNLLQTVTPWKSIISRTALLLVQTIAAINAVTDNNHLQEAVMKKRNLLLLTLSSLFLITGFAACRHGYHRGGFDEFDIEAATNRIASRLDLSETQKAELKTIAGEITAKAKEMHTDRQTRHQELADLVRQEAISRVEVDQKIDDKLTKMKELADFAADRLIAFHATLTPEQREKVAEHIEEHASDRCGFFRR